MSAENRGGWIALTLAVLGLLTALVQSDPFKTWFQWFMQSKHPSEITASPSSAPVLPAAHSYKNRFIPVSQSSDNDSNLSIRQVDLTPQATILQMHWQQSGKPYDGSSILIYPPASPEAFRLFDADYSHSYRLLDVIGFPTDKRIYSNYSNDDWKQLQYNFTLKFEPLPEDTIRFHLVEGDGKPVPGHSHPWTFTNIPLQ